MAETRERFGILIRSSGRFEIVQLGTEGGTQTLLDALDAYFEGPIEYARNAEGLAYVTRENAFFEGYTRNEAATYFAGIGTFGDCIVLPKRKGNDRITWSRADAYRLMIRMECDWEWYVDWSQNPEKYNQKIRKAVKA